MRCLFSVAVAVVASLLCVNPGSAKPDLARGKYLVTLGDCEICHTAPMAGEKAFAGGFPLHTWFGTFFSTNITPDKATGIGAWTKDDFFRAVHDGVDADGDHLYPAFPYPYFGKTSRADSDAMFAYLRTVGAVSKPAHPNRLIVPFGIRWIMPVWNWLFSPQSPFKPDGTKSADWNRGGEIVNGLGHCGGCHTPKNILLSDKSSEFLRGTTMDGWYAPNLTGSAASGLGKWSTADIEQFLKTGKNRFGWVVGSMRDVVRVSSSQWTDKDRHAVAVYLKSLPAAPEDKPQTPSAAQMANGQATFVARCAVCHAQHNGDYPRLGGNTLVNTPNPATLLRVILEGSQPPAIPGRPSNFSMPGFAVLSDAELADVATFIRNSWTNHASPVSASEAAQVRGMLAALK